MENDSMSLRDRDDMILCGVFIQGTNSICDVFNKAGTQEFFYETEEGIQMLLTGINDEAGVILESTETIVTAIKEKKFGDVMGVVYISKGKVCLIHTEELASTCLLTKVFDQSKHEMLEIDIDIDAEDILNSL